MFAETAASIGAATLAFAATAAFTGADRSRVERQVDVEVQQRHRLAVGELGGRLRLELLARVSSLAARVAPGMLLLLVRRG